MRFLIGFKKIDCPCCDKIHFVRKYIEQKEIEMQGNLIKYWSVSYFCNKSSYEDLQWFETSKTFDKDLKKIRKKRGEKQ